MFQFIGSDAVQVEIKNASYSKKILHCCHQDTALEPFLIFVGYEPGPVNISCKSEDFHNLEFTFQEEPNTILTNYKVLYAPDFEINDVSNKYINV